MLIIEDKGNKAKKHNAKHNYFANEGILLNRYPLPCGDYILATDKVLDVISRKKKRGLCVKKMDFLGSYDKCIDTKQHIQEVIGNICGKEHARFRDELILAQNNNIKMIVLVENTDGVTCVEDLYAWENPRKSIQKWITTPGGQRRKVLKYPNATSGETLAKAMRTMEKKYGVEFHFCTPEDAGKTILELLEEV